MMVTSKHNSSTLSNGIIDGSNINKHQLSSDGPFNSLLEQNLNDHGKILSMIYENTSDALALINVDDERNFSFLSVNQKFIKIGGITKEICIGKKIDEIFPADIMHSLYRSIRWLMKNKKPLNKEIMLNLQNENYYFDASLIPILSMEGKCISILMVAHDLTERKIKENELLKAKEEAEESNRLKATLLANMNHEVRTPLTAILGFAEFLEEDLNNPDNRQLAQYIRTSGKRLLRTLNSIIELSRLEADKIEIYKTKLNMNDTLQQLAKRFQPEAEMKGLFFETIINTTDVSFHLDQALFSQIMINLIDNAIKFTKTGGVKIIVDNEIEGNKTYIAIKVIDTGIGISKNNLKTIFQEFKQESEGWGRSHEGMGLGLSLVKRMTELMSGNVFVQSEKHKGSTFTVKFLCTSETSNEDSDLIFDMNNDNTQDTIKEIPNILVVEDNELNRKLTQLYLKNIYNVELAEEAVSALRLIKEKQYDAILMDINLGDGMNGVDALTEIRNLPLYKKTPVFALTGYAMGFDKQNLLNCGFTGYLAKPFEKNQLLKLLSDILSTAN